MFIIVKLKQNNGAVASVSDLQMNCDLKHVGELVHQTTRLCLWFPVAGYMLTFIFKAISRVSFVVLIVKLLYFTRGKRREKQTQCDIGIV